MGVCNCYMLCCTILCVHFSSAIILMGKRELFALLSLSSWCLVMVVWLFLAGPWVCLQLVIVVFPDHTHLLFLSTHFESLGKPHDSTSVRKAMPNKLDIKILTLYSLFLWYYGLVIFAFFFFLIFLRHTGITFCNDLIMKLKRKCRNITEYSGNTVV